MDLTDVQSILELKLLFDAFICWQEYSLRQNVFLPALCNIITLVYFFPKKVRRSVLSSLNSLSHSPEQTAKQTQRTDILNTEYLTCIGCKKILND